MDLIWRVSALGLTPVPPKKIFMGSPISSSDGGSNVNGVDQKIGRAGVFQGDGFEGQTPYIDIPEVMVERDNQDVGLPQSRGPKTKDQTQGCQESDAVYHGFHLTLLLN
jgi:hypothetical protein